MSLAGQLYQLQQVDLEIEANEKALSQITSQLGDRQAVTSVQTKLDTARHNLEELQKQQRATEYEVADLTAKITAAEKKLYGGTIHNPKELMNLETEVTAFKTNRGQLEDKVLKIMEQTEQSEASVVNLNNQLKEVTAAWQRQQSQLSVRLEQVKATLSQLRSQRELFRADIDAQTTALYQQLRSQKGMAVSRVEQGTCNCCRISVSTGKLQQVRGSTLVQCSSCGRILFLA